MLHLICGRKGCGKTEYIANSISRAGKQGTLLLVPETRSHISERLLCRVCGNSLSSFCEVTSFRRLAARVKSEVGGLASASVGGGERILLLHSAVKGVSKALKTLRPLASRPESLENILTAIDEFKSYGISAEQLASVSKSLSGALRDKIFDLSLIYSAYDGALGDDSLDAYDEISRLAELLSEHDFFRGKTVYLDSFTGFTSAEFDIIENAAVYADDVYVTLTLPENCRKGDENGIFDKTLDTMAKISAHAEKHGIGIEKIYLEKDCPSALSVLETSLFSDSREVFDGETPITIVRAEDVFAECELAAAYIIDRLRDDGARLRDFTVAVSDEGTYLPVVEQVFMRYGIPVYISEKTPITEKPAVTLITSALDCVIRDFRTASVTDYIKSGFSGICSKTLAVFENYLFTHSPRGREFASDFTRNPLGLTAEETDESRGLLRIINCAREKIYKPLKTLSDRLRTGKTAIKCAEAILDFTDEIHLSRRFDAYAYLAEQNGRLREAQEYRLLYEILTDAVSAIGIALGETRVSCDELLVLFKLVVSQYALDTIPASLDCISVFGLDRADGERNRHMMILGAEEGLFPASDSGTGLLSDSDRRELSDLGIELSPDSDSRMFESYRVIHSVINGAEDDLYISSPSSGLNGEEIAESHTVSHIRKLFPSHSEHYPLSEARLRALRPCLDESIARGFSEELFPEHEILKTRRSVREPITDRGNIEGVFGKRISMSASRADAFSSCRFAYFMKYGLKIKPRERAEVTPILIGNMMHYVIEHAVKVMTAENDFSEGRARALSESLCAEYIALISKKSGGLDSHTEFLLSRLKRAVVSAVRDICRELSKGKFVPTEFELKFSEDGDLPPIIIEGDKCSIVFRGAIDRVDCLRRNGRIYFRVVDYKSGKKEFSLDEAVNGVGMQMLLYMFALEDMGFSRYGEEPFGAGVIYIPTAPDASPVRNGQRKHTREGVILGDADIIDAMEEGDVKEYLPVSYTANKSSDDGNARCISDKSSVLYPAQFRAVKERLFGILRKIGNELSCGNIAPNPYVQSQRTSCDWCPYRTVCAFDCIHGNDSFRPLIDVKSGDITKNCGGEENE